MGPKQLDIPRAWIVAQKPLGPKVGSDSFANWTRAVQGVLGIAGWSGTVGHVDTVRKDSNDEEVEWATFLAAVWSTFGDEAWTVEQMLDKLSNTFLDEDVLPADMNPHSTKSAGMWLRNRNGRWAGPYVLRAAPRASNGTSQWKVFKQ